MRPPQGGERGVTNKKGRQFCQQLSKLNRGTCNYGRTWIFICVFYFSTLETRIKIGRKALTPSIQ
jgi:hypothetical protein